MYVAENLTRLNKISVVTEYDGQTVESIGRFSMSGQDIEIENKNSKYITKIHLPIIIQEQEQPRISGLSIPTGGILSFSLNLSSNPNDSHDHGESFMTQTNQLWSCKDLKLKTPKIDTYNQFNFNCLSCNNILIDSKNYKFLDMPSEFWYELMDFWHCHKPDNHDEHDKNYNASLRPPDDKSIIIGSNYLLINKCEKIEILNAKVICHQCKSLIGEIYENTARIFKWKIYLSYEKSGKIKETFSSYFFVYDLFINRINSTASRKFKFIIDNVAYYFWVLGVGINVSVEEEVLGNALKLVFRSNDQVDQLDQDDDDEYEYLAIPLLQLHYEN
ncbi:ubiquitin-conjugating enzyme E2-binding protein [Scheffersomyces amazonensis]|uniref:ubiquitin-conjugating enzyme E2-binding protein n=1 Tax=Scheffersomyces amazonensis TaxID=1078765 RepID=UPI00315CD3DD